MFQWFIALFTTTDGCIKLLWLEYCCHKCAEESKYRSIVERIDRLEERVGRWYG